MWSPDYQTGEPPSQWLRSGVLGRRTHIQYNVIPTRLIDCPVLRLRVAKITGGPTVEADPHPSCAGLQNRAIRSTGGSRSSASSKVPRWVSSRACRASCASHRPLSHCSRMECALPFFPALPTALRYPDTGAVDRLCLLVTLTDWLFSGTKPAVVRLYRFRGYPEQHKHCFQ